MLIESASFETHRTVSASAPSHLNSHIRAKPPANPMDIACPASSTWVALCLIRFRKRPHHFAACDRGVFARQSDPLDGPFRRVDALVARWVFRRIDVI